MKVKFSAFIGSSENHEVAHTVREQVNGKFAVYKGSKPIQKDIINFPLAVNIMIDKMGIWKNV